VVFTHSLAVSGFDRARQWCDVLLQKLPERPFANKADAGAVALCKYRQTGLSCQVAHLRLVQFANRHHDVGKVGAAHCMQKIGLVFLWVQTLEQLRPLR
jgi:hypothetical protein